jgi:hypothetical protein
VDDTRYAAAAAKILAASRVPATPPSVEARDTAIAALAAAMGDRRRGQHRQRVIWLAAAAAVVLAVGAAGLRLSNGGGAVTLTALRVGAGARVFRDGASTVLDEGYAVAAGDRVAAGPGEGIGVRLSTGTSLKLEAAGELQLVEAGPVQRFRLLKGTVRADVAKLHQGERFLVTTPDAEIEVRGTSFRLSATGADTVCDEPSTTRLEVFEGLVAVRRRDRVTLVAAGNVWPTGCRQRTEVVPLAPAVTPAPAPPLAAPARSQALRMASPPTGRAHGPARPYLVATPPEEASSTLAVQNDLYGRAVTAALVGEHERALETFRELERRFPSSPLGESSMVGRMRLLAEQDRDAGRAVAREYLARFPAGFARAEAQALLAGSPGR